MAPEKQGPVSFTSSLTGFEPTVGAWMSSKVSSGPTLYDHYINYQRYFLGGNVLMIVNERLRGRNLEKWRLKSLRASQWE